MIKRDRVLISFPVIVRKNSNGLLSSNSYMWKQLEEIDSFIDCHFFCLDDLSSAPLNCKINIDPDKIVNLKVHSERLINLFIDYLSIKRKIKRLLDEQDYKAIIIFEPLLLNAIVAKVAVEKKIKIIPWLLGDHESSLLHTAKLYTNLFSKIKTYLKYIMMKPILRYLLRNGDIVITDSPVYGNSSKIHFLPSPTLSSAEMLTHPQSKRDDKDITISLLFVGRIVPLKGIHILILAVEEIIKQIDLRVWIVGPSYGPNYNGYEFMLKKMLERKHLRDTIIFTGNISEREVLQDYYLRADCFVLPSLTEGTPKAVLEAMSFGLPVIATRIGGLPNVVRDGIDGVLVTPGSKDELVNAIVRLSMNRHLRTTMGASGREHVNNFTKERVFNEIANLIRDKNRDEPNI